MSTLEGQVDLFHEDARDKLRAPRSVDHARLSRMCGCDTGDESVTQQQFAEEADVNVIVRRFGMNQVPAVRLDGVYGDFTGISDLESARLRVEAANASFMTLPPEVRERFGNDPGLFVEYASTVNPDELVAELGLQTAVPAAPVGLPAPAAPAEPAAPASE